MTIEQRDKIKKIIAMRIGIDDSFVSEDEFTDIGADPLDMVEIQLTLEEQFGIRIGDEDWDQVVKVGDVYKIMEDILK